MSTQPIPSQPSSNGEPTWEALELLPYQGEWSESDFLRFHTNRMAELVNGRLEILPMPTWLHQMIVAYLMDRIKDYLRTREVGGVALFAPLPVNLFPNTIREPDILYVAPDNIPKDPRGYPERLDFVIEVVSSGDKSRKRDYEEKRIDYAKAAVAEYWIVDPDDKVIIVLGLREGQYDELGRYVEGDRAESRFLAGLTVDVSEIFAVADRQPQKQ